MVVEIVFTKLIEKGMLLVGVFGHNPITTF